MKQLIDKLKNKSLSAVLVIFCLIACKSKREPEKLVNKNNPEFERIFPFALRGELQNVFGILDTIDEKKLNEKELKLKGRYYNRFVSKTEKYEYKVKDSVIIKFVDMFHSYWNNVMIDGEKIDRADSLFSASMANYLYKHKYESENISFDMVKNNIYEYSNEFLKNKGYFSNAFGKTGHLYDLFLWKKEETVNYSIKLVDESINVTAYLMDDFISTGWSHYTTFGRNYASGWANREALFCVVNAYDINSENYKISYLTHEGQHFYDYKKYPMLKQKDLEYRAKLVELIKSNSTTIKIIKKFIGNASNQPENAHAFSNYCVIRDLSKAIFSKDYTTEKSDWMSIDSKLIREESKKLFGYNTKKLDSVGNNIVTEFIK